MISKLSNLFNEVRTMLSELSWNSTFADYCAMVRKELFFIAVVIAVILLIVCTIISLPGFMFLLWYTSFIPTKWIKHCIAVREIYDPVEEQYNNHLHTLMSCTATRTEKNSAISSMLTILKEHRIAYEDFDIDDTPMDKIIAALPRLRSWYDENKSIPLLGDFTPLGNTGPYSSFRRMHIADIVLRVILSIVFLALYVSFVLPFIFMLF